MAGTRSPTGRASRSAPGRPPRPAYDAANRPTSGTNPTVTYASDDDGRLTARPSQTMTWDHLGRLTTVKNGRHRTLATYTYDPLDRLRIAIGYGGRRPDPLPLCRADHRGRPVDRRRRGHRHPQASAPAGRASACSTGPAPASNIRIYGENGHHDVTWLASNTGTVSQSLRYDPWGNPRATVPSGYTPVPLPGLLVRRDDRPVLGRHPLVRPTLGRFISEDSLLGEPVDPPHGTSTPTARASRSPAGIRTADVQHTQSFMEMPAPHLAATPSTHARDFMVQSRSPCSSRMTRHAS